MFDYFELTPENHFFDGEWLYLKKGKNVYQFLLKNYKDLKRQKSVYLTVHQIDTYEYYWAFYDQQVRDFFNLLLINKFVNLSIAEQIIKIFNMDEIIFLLRKIPNKKTNRLQTTRF